VYSLLSLRHEPFLYTCPVTCVVAMDTSSQKEISKILTSSKIL